MGDICYSLHTLNVRGPLRDRGAKVTERVGRARDVVVERAGRRDSHGTSLGERILVGAEVHERPAVLGLLLDQVLDVHLGIRVTGVLGTVGLDDEYDARLGLVSLDGLADGVQQGGRAARLESLGRQRRDVAQRRVLVDVINFMIELDEGQLTPDGLLVRDKGVEAADRVDPASLHGARAIEEEDESTVHSMFLDGA
ncbi:hypothetical protein [Yellowstone lake phycodnavirus 3]|uniref:hypothetical protein n=1 Tax=Yellowstone lake phycodnavirus 3 TaxID=1586715 RepID=UPI0006EB8CE8|nr:hypothetical protein AR677_gp057 [Yellowstone lake phycodnavirus 3]BAT22556.1 hypothetical protein [Yellowstone lake phycodnavirus 3]